MRSFNVLFNIPMLDIVMKFAGYVAFSNDVKLLKICYNELQFFSGGLFFIGAPCR